MNEKYVFSMEKIVVKLIRYLVTLSGHGEYSKRQLNDAIIQNYVEQVTCDNYRCVTHYSNRIEFSFE